MNTLAKNFHDNLIFTGTLDCGANTPYCDKHINCTICTNHKAKAGGKCQGAIKPGTQLRRVAVIRKHGGQPGSADAAASIRISGMDETKEQVL